MKLLGSGGPLAFVCFASGLLLSGCQSSPPGPPLPPRPEARLTLSAIIAPPPPPPLVWHWECFETPLDGTMTTGIESSTNLGPWTLEAEWPVLTVSNSWTEPDRSPPVKFYRAFIR